MRELLDNQRRADTARSWYLKPFLETLVERVTGDRDNAIGEPVAALAVVYQLLGAITYFAVSQPTLTQMFGAKDFAKLRDGYDAELRTLIGARLEQAR